VPSPDGRFLVPGAHDQTVRLWNLKTSEQLVTLFHGMDGEWVMWTP
jgi:WD40 repeat protein